MANEIAAKLEPLQHQSAPLRNKIIATLRNAIETGILEPGARLVERDLCSQLNVSRTSLREALRELQAEGILCQTDSRGLTVGTVTREDAENVYRIRSVLEALVVEQFIERATDEDIRLLIKDSDALKSAYRSGLIARIAVSKRAFYDRICSGAANTMAFDIINRLVLRTSSLRSRSLQRKERQQQSIKEVDAIVDAIRLRDPVTAKQAAIEHVQNSARSALGGTEPGSTAADPAAPLAQEPLKDAPVKPASKRRQAVTAKKLQLSGAQN